MLGQPEIGKQFLDQHQQHWTTAHFMAGHLHWHGALHCLEAGPSHHPLVWQCIETEMIPRAQGHGPLDLINASALLVRFSIALGLTDPPTAIEHTARFRALHASVAKLWRPLLRFHQSGFNDAHAVLSLMLGTPEEIADDCTAFFHSLQVYAERPVDSAAAAPSLVELAAQELDVVPAAHRAAVVGYRLVRALQLLGQDPAGLAAMATQLAPLVPHLEVLGGSFAQRDLFSQLFLWAICQLPADDCDPLVRELARDALRARDSRKPVSNLSALFHQRLDAAV
jgi:hypothetical protein